MAEIVTGTPSVVGFTNGHHGYDHGWSAKDNLFAGMIDAGERTRDVLSAIADTNVNVEKNGAASSLATEKIGAAIMLSGERLASVQTLALANIGCDIKTQLAQCCCDIKEAVSAVNATVLAVDANRIRDSLQQAQVELLMLKNSAA